MEAWVSWAAFLAIVGAAYWYYSQNDRSKARGRSTTRTTTTSSAKQPIQWSDEEKKSSKPAKAKAPRKSVKKAVQEVGDKVEAVLSTNSSTAGVDADDDLSPVASPSLGATAPSGRNVSDMLESKGPAPGVLKINASEKPARQAKQQQARPETPQETKKQRQNRKKAEEAKAQREEDEKQRQLLLEKQRRTAREARGEAAKNGLQSAKAPASNAWTTVGSSGHVQAPVVPSGQLLDTFEAASTASSSEAATNGTAPTPDSLSNSYTNLPSEEEQMRLAMEESAWTTVPKGGKKQRKPNAEEEEGADSIVPQESTPVSAPAPAPVKPAKAKKSENTKPASRYEVLSAPASNVSHPMDSDWPVV